jgi:predicted metalloprotease with PDZ domain
MRLTTLALTGAALAAVTSAAAAQQDAPRARARTFTLNGGRGNVTVVTSGEDDRDRAWLGIGTSSGGKRDTLGLLIQSVSPNSPADKAGLEEGMRLQSINGTSLKLDREDAGEPELTGMMQRRLQRELAKVKPGDEVSLGVWAAGSVRTLRVKTGSPEDLMPEEMRAERDRLAKRGVLGVMLAGSHSKRDTLGVFVSGVSEGGPADKAGIAEGDRIAAIDGVDLRVPREDAGDASVGQARTNRLNKALRGKSAGDEVTLRVVSGGRSREVKVKLAKPGDLKDGMGFWFETGPGGRVNINGLTMPRLGGTMMRIPGGGVDLEELELPLARIAPVPPEAPMAPLALPRLNLRAPAPLAPRRPAVGTVSI